MDSAISPERALDRERIARMARAERCSGLTFCDLSSFYGPTAGGIRTYHEAKLRWFAAQQRHRYVLIHPGRRFGVEQIGSSVTVITTYGAPAGAGYRLPVDVRSIRKVVRELNPDILETGDPWFSGPFGLWFRKSGFVRGLVTSFFHGDPMRTYVDPWIARGTMDRRLRHRLGARADRWFYQVQGLYDFTLASSEGIERALRARGVKRVLRAPFGVDPLFLHAARLRHQVPRGASDAPSPARGGPVRLLYAGRLQADKGVDLLIAALPRLLRRGGVTLTIAGRGPLAEHFTSFTHPRLRVLGFVASRDAMARLYAEHDVLLAPGAHETFGLSGLEALAAGLVVVGPDAGGTGELMAQLASPCIFAAGDVDDFLRAVDDAIEGDHERRARDGIALAERYGTWEQAIGRQVDRYCECLHASLRRHRIAVETSPDMPMMQER